MRKNSHENIENMKNGKSYYYYIILLLHHITFQPQKSSSLTAKFALSLPERSSKIPQFLADLESRSRGASVVPVARRAVWAAGAGSAASVWAAGAAAQTRKAAGDVPQIHRGFCLQRRAIEPQRR